MRISAAAFERATKFIHAYREYGTAAEITSRL